MAKQLFTLFSLAKRFVRTKMLNSCTISFQIKVSVSSGGDCLRSYRPDIRKGRYNTITLHVKTTVPDNLLLYLGSAKYVSGPVHHLVLSLQLELVNFCSSFFFKNCKLFKERIKPLSWWKSKQ